MGSENSENSIECEPIFSARRSATSIESSRFCCTASVTSGAQPRSACAERAAARPEVRDARGAAPPDEEVVRQPLFERPGIEVQPLHAVVHFEQLFGLHRT